MRRLGFGGMVLAGLLLAAPAGWAGGTPIERTQDRPCASKRTDACGCHHYYGLRHCHPKRKTDKCERPVSWSRAVPEPAAEVSAKPEHL